MNKKERIKDFYSSISPVYAKVNDIMTFGLDRYWRKTTAKRMVAIGGTRWLDVCCGTGDMTSVLTKISDSSQTICAVDFSEEMLELAKSRSYSKPVSFQFADALHLPFEDNTFDQVVISFATRNLDASGRDLIDYFSEFHRVLKPGGHFINLETSQPKNNLVSALFRFYIRVIIPPLAILFSGEKKPYKFLSETILRFYGAEKLREIILRSGFSEASFDLLTFGICAIHVSVKGREG